MKKILLLVTFIFSLNSFSQKDPNVYDFFGGKSFGYDSVFFRLVFQIDNDIVSGYMYTDEQGNGETKSIIKGKINKKTKQIIFSETRKLLSKAKNNSDDLCYVTGHMLLELNPKISKLKGSFIENTDYNQKCRNGKISLISPDAFIKLNKYLNTKQITKVKPVIKKETKKHSKIIIPNFEVDKKTTIKDNEELTIYWTINNLKIVV